MQFFSQALAPGVHCSCFSCLLFCPGTVQRNSLQHENEGDNALHEPPVFPGPARVSARSWREAHVRKGKKSRLGVVLRDLFRERIKDVREHDAGADRVLALAYLGAFVVHGKGGKLFHSSGWFLEGALVTRFQLSQTRSDRSWFCL